MCYTRKWERIVQRPKCKENPECELASEAIRVVDHKLIVAEIEFISILQKRIDMREFIPMSGVSEMH